MSAPICPTCNRSLNQILECRDCSAKFELTPEHLAWYTAKALALPKRCKPCRDTRRELMKNAVASR